MSDTKSAGETPALIDINAIRNLAVASAKPHELEGFKPAVIVPRDFELVNLDRNPRPKHIKQTVTLDVLASFVAYVLAFKTQHTVLFGTTTPTGASFQASLDYHHAPRGPGEAVDARALTATAIDSLTGEDDEDLPKPENGLPGRKQHLALFKPSYSPEFQAWLALNRKAQTQVEFLDFIRRWGHVVTNLESADLIEMSENLNFTTAGQFSSKIDRIKGGRKLTWNEDVQGNATMRGQEIPVQDYLKLNLPIFKAGRTYDLECDILYRVNSGKLAIILDLRREHVVVQQAVDDLVADVASGTGITPFIGSI